LKETAAKERYRDALEAKIEELSRFQAELEASRNQYALLYDFAPVGYFTFDRNGVIRKVNLTGARLLGLDRTHLAGERFESFVVGEDRFVFVNYISCVFKNQGKMTCRLGLTQRDRLPLYVRIEAMVAESGDECLAVLVDITEKKLAERALSESEYNLAKAQSMTHVGSWSFDPVTGSIKASDELLRILRLAREATNQESFAAAVHPEDRDKVFGQLRLCIEQAKSYEIEHRLKFADGSGKWVYSIVEPLLSGAGKVMQVYGTTQDISERKQAEVELSNKTNELQAIFDSISDGITVYDHDGRVQHHNQISPALFPGKIHPGKRCQDVFHTDLKEPGACPVERALAGERVETSFLSMREGKETLYLDITATPIKDTIGDNTRALVFMRDVSEKRLQEMHLIQAEKMSSIGVLATGIAHEINNPLASVAGCAEGLLRRFNDTPGLSEDPRLDAFQTYLQVIVRESYRCKGIIDNLLSFGRKSDGLAVNVDLNTMLREIIELISHQPSFRGVRLTTSLQEGLPCVHGDPSALRQVCMNLLINAHQAIPGEGGAVEVATCGPSAGMISVVIGDNGCGIPAENLDRIWDPFFTTKEAGKGIGLGLALSYSIVKRHHGEIQVKSRVGEGTQFTVLLPVSTK